MNQQLIVCACPQCGTKFRVPAEMQGKKGVCKSCQAKFVVQGVPVAAGAATAPAAPGGSAAPAASPPAARLASGATPAAARPAVAPLTPAAAPDDPFAPIPLEDAPVSLESSGASAHVKVVSDDTGSDKTKFQPTGHYYVHRITLSGQLKQVPIEKALNECAADGWRLLQIFPIGNEVFAVMARETDHPTEQPPPYPSDA